MDAILTRNPRSNRCVHPLFSPCICHLAAWVPVQGQATHSSSQPPCTGCRTATVRCRLYLVVACFTFQWCWTQFSVTAGASDEVQQNNPSQQGLPGARCISLMVHPPGCINLMKHPSRCIHLHMQQPYKLPGAQCISSRVHPPGCICQMEHPSGCIHPWKQQMELQVCL